MSASPTGFGPAKIEGGRGSLFVFDAYNFIFRAYHALPPLSGPDGIPVGAVHGFVRMVQQVRREFEPEFMLAVFDAGGDGGRREQFAGYKAQRPPPPDDLIPQFDFIREAVDALGIPRVDDPRYEADDVIASYALEACRAGKRVVVVSSDKDLMQLVTVGEDRPSLLLWDTMKKKAIGPDEVVEKFGVGPALLGDLLALTGDTSDNIPGVPGIGPKTAAQLLLEYGDLEGVLAAAPSIKQKVRRERLVEHADAARLSRRLVELRKDLPLPKPLDELRDNGPNAPHSIALFEALGLRQILREMGLTGAGVRGPSAAPTPRVADDDPGGIELLAVPGFDLHRDGYRTMLGADAAALDEWVGRWQRAAELVVSVAFADGDPMFAEPLGLAVGGVTAEGEPIAPVYLPFGHRQADLMTGPQLSAEAALHAVAPLLEAADRAKVVDDHKMVAHALSRFGVTLRGVTVDPMLASYVLDSARSSHDLASLAKDVLGHRLTPPEDVLGKGRKATLFCDLDPGSAGAWICERVEVTAAVGHALAAQLADCPKPVSRLFYDLEMPLASVLQRIERIGIAIDPEALHAQSEELSHVVAEIQARVDEVAGYHVNLDSPIQLQKFLFDERQLPITRKTKTGFSTDAKALEELALLDPVVRDILEYRQFVKLKNTYLDALPKLVRPETGRLHTSFRQAVAATGRLSSTDPNLQNIPIRTAEGRRIREAFVAPPGRRLVALDYSQIELRILAHLSGDPNLMSAFIEGVDVHRRTAAEVFEVDEEEVTDEQRRIAKAVNFGVVYGQTAHGLAQQLGIPRGKAGSYIRAYFEKVPGVQRYMEDLIGVTKVKGYAETLLGRRRRIPELSAKGPARSHGERIARNTPIQGSAADILKLAMIAVDRELQSRPWAQMLLTVHDELIFECDDGRVDELIGVARPLMERAFELKVPLLVEAGHGRTWGDCKG